MHFARYFPFCFLAPSHTKSPRRKEGWRNPQQGMILQGASLRGRLPPPATLAHKEESIEQNANEADSEVRDFRCKLMTCKCQELHARGYQRERRMYMVSSKQIIQEESPTAGKYYRRQLQAKG